MFVYFIRKKKERRGNQASILNHLENFAWLF